MLPYVILMFAPLLVYQVAVNKQQTRNGQGWSISIGKTPEILYNSLIVPVFFFLLFLLLSLRNETIGRDIVNYHNSFIAFSLLDFRDLWSTGTEPLYVLLNWIVGRFTDDFQIFLTIVAAITVLPVAKIYSEDKQYGFLKIVLFMNMTVFIMMFSGLRQAIAISVSMVAYSFVRKKKPLLFLLFALIAFGFHHTGFITLLYYPLYHLKLSKNQQWLAIPGVAIVFIFNKQIFGLITSVLSKVFGDRYEVEIQETGAYLMIVLFALFAIAAFFFPDEEKMDAEAKGLRSFLLMTLLLQCFAPVHTLSMRMNYYFIIFVPVIVPKIFKYSKDNIKDVAKIAKGVIVTFFVVYYLYTTFVSCRTGVSALDTYPYVPFWKY